MKLVLTLVAAAIVSTTGSLTQLSGSAGCVNSSGRAGCAKARGVGEPFALAVSRDGRNVYSAGGVALGAIASFSRSRSGALTPLRGKAACTIRTRSRVCGIGRGLETPAAIAVSPDGRVVVTAARNGGAIGIYRRKANGVLVASACFQTGASRGCREARALRGASGLAFSPGGALLVVAASDGLRGGLSLFRNDAGRVTAVGCVNATGRFGCVKARGLFAPVAVAFTRDGGFAYVVSGGGKHGSLSTFQLGVHGEVEQLQCVEQGAATEGCQRQPAGLAQPAGVAVAPDYSTVYVVSTVSAALVAFPRTKVGAVEPGVVHTGVVLRRASGVAVTPDSRRVLVSADRHVVEFTRRDGEGLTQTRAMRPRGVTQLRAVAITPGGRNAYAAGHGIATFRLS